MTDKEKARNFAVSLNCENMTMGELMALRQGAEIGYLAALKAGREEKEKQWHDCFLSCSSPYCAGHFPAVKMEGELGNMSKREGNK